MSGFHQGILNLAMEPSLLGSAFIEGGPNRKIKLDRSPGIDEVMTFTVLKNDKNILLLLQLIFSFQDYCLLLFWQVVTCVVTKRNSNYFGINAVIC